MFSFLFLITPRRQRVHTPVADTSLFPSVLHLSLSLVTVKPFFVCVKSLPRKTNKCGNSSTNRTRSWRKNESSLRGKRHNTRKNRKVMVRKVWNGQIHPASHSSRCISLQTKCTKRKGAKRSHSLYALLRKKAFGCSLFSGIVL